MVEESQVDLEVHVPDSAEENYRLEIVRNHVVVTAEGGIQLNPQLREGRSDHVCTIRASWTISRTLRASLSTPIWYRQRDGASEASP